ncbi:unnamed protein product [Clonostachys rhizophaga]|uniref:Uncharacterized protein n=1 Tax=Clonostachys rhizophaga TaxID=160324 RepID=A0A9N9VR52_9HYPO|nr:unnamed protein product [Clonostachys rhizophaga]
MYLKYPTDLPSATATIQELSTPSTAPTVEKIVPLHPGEFLIKLKEDADPDVWRHVKWDEDIHGKSSADKGIYTGLEEVLKYLEKEGYIGSYDDDVLDQMKQHPDTKSLGDCLYTWNETVLEKNELGETIAKDVPLFGTERVDQKKGDRKERGKGRKKEKIKKQKEKETQEGQGKEQEDQKQEKDQDDQIEKEKDEKKDKQEKEEEEEGKEEEEEETEGQEQEEEEEEQEQEEEEQKKKEEEKEEEDRRAALEKEQKEEEQIDREHMDDAEKKARERHRIEEEEWIEWYHWLAVLPLFTCVVS